MKKFLNKTFTFLEINPRLIKRTYLSILSAGISAIILFLSSCDPFYPEPSPLNYEDFVEAQDKYPKFSPDGEFIAYYHYSSELPEPPDYPSGLYIIDKDGSDRQLVLEGHHENPDWSPDGQWLVFSSRGLIQKCKINGDSLTAFEGLGGQGSSFEDALFFPDWTLNGKYILFDRAANKEGESNLYSMNSDFTLPQPIFGNVVIAGRDPELSPDGKTIVYMRWLKDWDFSEIFIMDTIGLNEVRLTENNIDDRGPTWSSDGSQVVWSSNIHLQTMNNDGSNQKFISYGNYPSWSLNDEIVFSHANSNYSKEVLYLINPDGSGKMQITF